MSEEQNKKVFERVIEEADSKGNLAVLDKVFAPNGGDGATRCTATPAGRPVLSGR